MEHESLHYRMLVVDDEPNILTALRRLFRKDPLDLIAASTAEEALETIKKYKIHVLLTDNKMPGMDGTELVRKVKEISPDTIRIMVSGQSDMEAVLSAVNDGEIFRFIQKPWSDIDLKITVNLAMAHCRLVHENYRAKKRLAEAERLLRVVEEKYPEVYEHCRTTTDPAIQQPVTSGDAAYTSCKK